MQVYENISSVVVEIGGNKVIIPKAMVSDLAKELEKGTGKHVFKNVSSYEVSIGRQKIILSEPYKNRLAFMLSGVGQNKTIRIRTIEYLDDVAKYLKENGAEKCAEKYYITESEAEKLKKMYPDVAEMVDELLEIQKENNYDEEEEDEEEEELCCNDCCEEFDEDADSDIVDECCDECCEDAYDETECKECMRGCIDKNTQEDDDDEEEEYEEEEDDNEEEDERVIVAKPGQKIKIVVDP